MLKAISTITNALGALNYKGTWNASTNNPTLADGTGAKGDYYVTSTAGTQTFGGLQLFFGIGDWIVYNGAVWQRVEGGSDGNFANVTMTSRMLVQPPRRHLTCIETQQVQPHLIPLARLNLMVKIRLATNKPTV